MAYWKYNKARGTKTLTHRTGTKITRKIGVRNLTDKTAIRMGRTRKPGYVNTTDGAKRKMHHRKKKSGYPGASTVLGNQSHF